MVKGEWGVGGFEGVTEVRWLEERASRDGFTRTPGAARGPFPTTGVLLPTLEESKRLRSTSAEGGASCRCATRPRGGRATPRELPLCGAPQAGPSWTVLRIRTSGEGEDRPEARGEFGLRPG
jgi:hypothetical protein